MTILIAAIFKSEHNWSWHFALAVVRVSATTVNCLCVGLRRDERNQLAAMVEEFAYLASNELLVPICLLSLTCHSLCKFVGDVQEDLWNVQRETGLYGSRVNKHANDFRILNFNNLAMRLTSMADNYSRSLSRIGTLQRMLLPLGELRASQAVYNLVKGRDEFAAQLSWIQQTLMGSQQHIKWLADSAASHMPTVQHSFPS